MQNKVSSKLISGIIIVVAGLLLASGNARFEPVINSDTFASEPIEIAGFETTELEAADIPQKLIIPSLNVFLDVRRADIVNGYWEVFEDSAGWGLGSGLPGVPGNQVIFAHARDGLFGPLDRIKPGSRILVLTQNEWFEYEVDKIDEVYPGNTKYIAQSDEEILTLYTCSGYQDSKRLIVVAKPV